MKLNSNLGRGLIVLVVAGSCGYATAATVTRAGGAAITNYTNAAAAGAGSTADIETVAIRVALGAAYAAGNQATLTLQDGAQFSGAAVNTLGTVKCSSAATNDSDLVMAYQSGGVSGSTSVTYLVQSVSAGQATSGLNCSFGTRAVLTRTLSQTAGVSTGISYSAKTDSTSSGTAIDNAVATASLLTANAQYTFGSVSGVSGTIDVTTGRLLFTAAPTAKPHNPLVNRIAATNATLTADAVQFRTGNLSLTASTSATQPTFEVAITGDFNFVNDNGGVCSADDLTDGNGRIVAWSETANTGSAAAPTRLSIDSGCGTLTYKVSTANAATAATGTIAANAPGDVTYHTITLQRSNDSAGLAFAVGSYGYTAPAFGATVVGTASSTGAGSFGSNGMVVDVPYMPFGKINGTDVGHVIVWNNKSTQSAALSVTAVKTGATSSSAGTACATNANLVTINSNSIQNISDVVRNYVLGCFGADYTATGGPRVSLRFEANLPNQSNELYTSFTVGSDRAFVGNSSTGRGGTRTN